MSSSESLIFRLLLFFFNAISANSHAAAANCGVSFVWREITCIFLPSKKRLLYRIQETLLRGSTLFQRKSTGTFLPLFLFSLKFLNAENVLSYCQLCMS